MTTMAGISLTADSDTISVQSPYHPRFVSRARELAGKWDVGARAWRFPLSQSERVRSLCQEVYGTDGTAPTVTLRVAVPEQGTRQLQLWAAGRSLARAYGRDSGAKIGEGIVVVSGGFTSGGSRANPELVVKTGTVVEILDCPEPAAEAYLADHPETAEIVR